MQLWCMPSSFWRRIGIGRYARKWLLTYDDGLRPDITITESAAVLFLSFGDLDASYFAYDIVAYCQRTN